MRVYIHIATPYPSTCLYTYLSRPPYLSLPICLSLLSEAASESSKTAPAYTLCRRPKILIPRWATRVHACTQCTDRQSGVRTPRTRCTGTLRPRAGRVPVENSAAPPPEEEEKKEVESGDDSTVCASPDRQRSLAKFRLAFSLSPPSASTTCCL